MVHVANRTCILLKCIRFCSLPLICQVMPSIVFHLVTQTGTSAIIVHVVHRMQPLCDMHAFPQSASSPPSHAFRYQCLTLSPNEVYQLLLHMKCTRWQPLCDMHAFPQSASSPLSHAFNYTSPCPPKEVPNVTHNEGGTSDDIHHLCRCARLGSGPCPVTCGHTPPSSACTKHSS